MQQYNIKAILFDLDGTLADTAHDLVHALNLSLLESGLPSTDYHKVCHAVTHGSLALVKAAQPQLAESQQKQLQQALLRHYTHINGHKSILYPKMAELLDHLDSVGMPYGVVTNKHASFARPLVAKLGLTHRLKSLISGDSTIHPKPHKAPMLLAAQQLNTLPKHILYLGDAERDIVAANNANMIAGAAHWGYLSATDSPKSWPADLHFASSESLYEYIFKAVKSI